MNAEYLRGVLNSFHENGLDLNIIEVRVFALEEVKFSSPNGTIHINVCEDGNSGTFTLEVP